MQCPECSRARMRRKAAPTLHQIRGMDFHVAGTVLVCPRCGFTSVPADQVAAHARLVDEAYRKAAGLLSATQIRDARRRHRMSQREFAAYLGVGEASVKRWELGALPDKSSDLLIRLRTDPAFAQANLEDIRQRIAISC